MEKNTHLFVLTGPEAAAHTREGGATGGSGRRRSGD